VFAPERATQNKDKKGYWKQCQDSSSMAEIVSEGEEELHELEVRHYLRYASEIFLAVCYQSL
jgi:hypothetical protein